MSGALTCITCSVAFKEATDQRDHYKTDWHRYNLKRKVAELAPVSEKAFKDRMVKHEEQRKVLDGETKRVTGYCVACSKSFATEKAYENHLNSKKHLEAAKAFATKANKEEIELNRKNRQMRYVLRNISSIWMTSCCRLTRFQGLSYFSVRVKMLKWRAMAKTLKK